MSAHPCPGCLRVTSRPGRCVACGGGTTTQRGYGADWRQRRAQQLLRHPACEWWRATDARACGRPATDVDHVVPKVYGGSDEPINLQSLCARHHRLKTATQDRRWGTHVERPEDPEDAAYLAYARPGFAIRGTSDPGHAARSRPWASQGHGGGR